MAKDGAGAGTFPGPQDASDTRPPTMLTTDLALRFDPIYEPISRRFLEHPEELADAFARAWFKLTHRDMGPIARYLGPEVPEETLLWQDPLPEVDHELIDAEDVAALKAQILDSGLSVAAAGVDRVGVGVDVPRQRQARWRQRRRASAWSRRMGWEVNDPDQLATVLSTLEGIQQAFNGAQSGGKQVSLADLIVLAGSAAVERAAESAGHVVTVPFTPGRADASQEQTDVESFDALEPSADGFRNYAQRRAPPAGRVPAARPREPADAQRAGDDRAASAACACWAPTPAGRRTASSRRARRR